jgi:hypothetical protein
MANEDKPGAPPPPSDASQSPPRASDAIAKDFHDATGQQPSGGRPIIQWKEGELSQMVDQAEDALMHAAHDHLFQRGQFIVRVVRKQAMSVRTFKRPSGGLGIVPVDSPYLVEQMTRAAQWEKFDTRTGDWRRINAPEKVAQTYLARSGHWKLPRLLGAISAPTLRPDGSLLQVPGYDQDTATWYDPCGLEFPAVPNKPTTRQATAALDTLLQAFDTIPFVAPSDASVAVALMLTSLVRRSLPSAPMGAITAPTPGSGKTLIADCISILATGVAAAAMQYAATDEESEKIALSVLMGGDPVVLIDNVERPLQGAWLCSILTSETHQGRILGRNEMMQVPTTTLFLATGNKLVIQGDLRTRALLCRIDPKHEKPEEREFKVELRDLFHRKRVELVTAGLTLMRAYLVGGEKSSVFRPWGRFEKWSQFCREPLMWLGLTDPCDSYNLIAQDDPERQEHMQMMAAWEATFGLAKKTTTREAIESVALDGNATLRDALLSVAQDRGGALSAKKLGHWLRAKDGRIVNGKMFRRAGETRDHVAQWEVVDAG